MQCLNLQDTIITRMIHESVLIDHLWYEYDMRVTTQEAAFPQLLIK